MEMEKLFPAKCAYFEYLSVKFQERKLSYLHLLHPFLLGEKRSPSPILSHHSSHLNVGTSSEKHVFSTGSKRRPNALLGMPPTSRKKQNEKTKHTYPTPLFG